jgi:HEAT repeat protein
MQTRYFVSFLAAVAIAVANTGCNTTTNSQQANDIAEIRSTLNKQREDIAALRKALASKTATSFEQDQLFDAAVLLARKSPENQSSTAIYLLGTIGGSKAEPILLEMLENASPNQLPAILTALSNIRSQKLHDILMKFLTSEENQQTISSVVSILNNSNSTNPNIVKKSDLPVIEKILEKYPDSDYNNNRYIRGMLLGIILRLDQDKGVQYICDDLQSATFPQKQNIIYLITNNNYRISFKSWEKIIKSTGDFDEFNPDIYLAILRVLSQTGDLRATDLILAWAEFAKTNDNFRRQYVDSLVRLRDPKAAKTLLDLYQPENLVNCKGRGNLDNYPGIRRENNNYVLVDAATMQKLLEQRAKKIESLNELDKRRAEKETESNPQPSKEKIVTMSAEACLGLMDEGKYSESWNEGSEEELKDRVKQQKWELAIREVRAPLGKLISRKVRNISYQTNFADAPDKQWSTIEFKTSFENKKSATEMVSLSLNKDGKWQVFSYSIR